MDTAREDSTREPAARGARYNGRRATCRPCRRVTSRSPGCAGGTGTVRRDGPPSSSILLHPDERRHESMLHRVRTSILPALAVALALPLATAVRAEEIRPLPKGNETGADAP